MNQRSRRIGNGLSPRRVSVGLSVALCAEPCQIKRRYCCIIGVTVAGTAVGGVLM